MVLFYFEFHAEIHFSAAILAALNWMVVDGSPLLSGTWEISVYT